MSTTSKPTEARQRSKPELLTERRVRDLDRMVGEAQDELEHLHFRCSAFIDAHDEGGGSKAPMPTLEDVGRLFSFVDGLKLDLWAIQETARKLEHDLEELDRLRRNAAILARTAAS